MLYHIKPIRLPKMSIFVEMLLGKRGGGYIEVKHSEILFLWFLNFDNMLNIRQDVPNRILQNLNNRIINVWNFSNVIWYKK